MWKNIIGEYEAAGMCCCSRAYTFFRDQYNGTNELFYARAVTNVVQIGTHADSLIAEAVLKGMSGFDFETAWEAVYKDAVRPPVNDSTTV